MRFFRTSVPTNSVWLFLLLGAGPAACFVRAEGVGQDPERIVGYENCQKCHGAEIDVWKKTPHFATFKELHRKPEAKAIAERMGVRSVKRGDLCLQCHYTQQASEGRVRAVSGISCESCHGGARDWLVMHNDYGGPTITKETETPEHRQQRLQESIANGMRNPENPYLVASSCLSCHTVPHEALVNVGAHQAGSEEFELVAWSQGSLRHNFLRSNGTRNAVSSPDRLRVLYLVGKVATLEYSLRAAALATEAQTFGFASGKRVFDTRRHLAELQEQVQHPLLENILNAAYGVKLKSNNREALESAADQIAALGRELGATENGSGLGPIDAYLPDPGKYR